MAKANMRKLFTMLILGEVVVIIAVGMFVTPNVRGKARAEACAVSPVCDDGEASAHRAYSACCAFH
jgi:hypothetical protein